MKYNVEYCSGATGYGWRKDFDRLDEFEAFIDAMRHEYTASVIVWDESRKQHIFWKDVLTFTPSIDDLQRSDRDYRTTTRSRKAFAGA